MSRAQLPGMIVSRLRPGWAIGLQITAVCWLVLNLMPGSRIEI